ncbi:nucleotidyltransferase family protein [Candidatus Xianfuyuplasma coldseepsis]|uniref:Nucleotidyltransferase family protein n=1 Tax=Candidatus Xianfuyuplasma coldseepsis TaxID=2782163 RepID=A0A7L7KNY4_9MOLU|nr:nucleotidyltransferase family protein [Xianfuyuplasma coldseepsis]QMS84413.1 nucleotidyltransferase family protein [Xianfuyuplasma coldseepsis]
MIDIVVLAGGKSSRYSENKLAQLMNDKPLLYYTIQPFLDFSNKVIIVSGHYSADYILPYLTHPSVQIVHNDNYEMGMFSSVQTGIKHATQDVMVIPGDCPTVKPSTIDTLCRGSGLIRVPVYQQRRGHPIFISEMIHHELLAQPITSNLKEFRDQYDVEYIQVDDPNILHDIDHQHDMKQLLRKGEVE